MFRFFRKHRSVVMVFLAACIGGLILFGVGGTSMMTTPQDTIIKINGAKITQVQFDRVFNQLNRQRETANTPQDKQQLQSMALNELIRQEVFAQEAKKYGIEVTDQALQLQLANVPAFQKDGHFDPTTYVRVVGQTFGINPREFEKNSKKDIAGRELNQLIATAVHVSDTQLEGEVEKRLKTETDSKKKKELQSEPEKVRQELQDKETNLVFGDWLNQLNSTLKVNVVSETFRQRMNAPAPAPASAPQQAPK